MPSFDVVSEVDQHELTNAVDQVAREVANRFDFKGTSAAIELNDLILKVTGDADFQLNQIQDVLHQKMAKRGLDIDSLEADKTEPVSGGHVQRTLTVRQGIDKETAKKIVKLVKDSKIKVQASIQGEQVRIAGKKRDDLQQVMAMLKEAKLGLPLQFTNFRDK